MSEYSAAPSTGRLKLKGVKDARIDKKKKKKNKSKPEDGLQDNEHFTDKSVVLQHLKDEDSKIAKDPQERIDGRSREGSHLAETGEVDLRDHLKTDAEKRYDEQRRKRLEERLKREGIKTHKERVEELNRYLSNLSEHHDMPKIGPG